MVRGVVIPASDSRELKLRHLDQLEDYQASVGGWIEAVDLPDLGATLYVNEVGLLHGLPFNRRATFLWWYHVPAARNQAQLVRDAVAVGLPDRHGSSTNLPAHVQSLFLEPSLHRVQVRSAGETGWRNDLAPDQPYFEAMVWASLIPEISPLTETRVVPAG